MHIGSGPIGGGDMPDCCVHCHKTLTTQAPDPRWRGYCGHCIKLLLKQRHPESAR
jgi:hypothetical protein